MPDEMETAIDQIMEQNNIPDEQPIDDVIEGEAVEEEPQDKPPGYMGYDDWVAAGKDPADFKGENAYKAEYERIQEIRDLKNTMNQVVEGVQTWQEQQQQQMQQQVDQARQEALAKIEQAKKDDDVEALDAAYTELNQVSQQAPPKQAPKMNPVIMDFFKDNPIIDESSAQFDKDFFEDMRLAQHAHLNKLTNGDPQLAQQLTPSQLKRSLTAAYNTAKEMNPDKFQSPRNKRTTTPSASPKKQQGGNVRNKLSGMKGKNQRDSNAGQEIYDLIAKADPKAAETFAKNVLGD